MTSVRLRVRLAAVGATIGAMVAVGMVALPADARAQSAGTTNIARVHHAVAAAERHYAYALDAVARSVSRSITVSESRDRLRQRAAAAQADLAQQVRGLYESGGMLGAYAAVLSSGNVGDLPQGATLATQLIGRQAADADTAAAADRVVALLAQERGLLRAAHRRLAVATQQAATFSSITSSGIAGVQVLPPPSSYLALYRSAAATCPGLSWTVLAAIGQVESGHGRDTSTSSAGAMGPMQFEPATFAAYAVDGDGDGTASIGSPADAIYTAARYLCANGAGRGSGALQGAILHYNHAEWYVEMVLRLAGLYASWVQ